MPALRYNAGLARDRVAGTAAALAEAGIKRISLATSLYRTAMTGLLIAAREVTAKGTLGYIDTTIATPELNGFMSG